MATIPESAELKSMTGSYNAKLVFRNDAQGNLVYMNFGKTTTVVQFEDGVEVFHPDISPNGKYVADIYDHPFPPAAHRWRALRKRLSYTCVI